MIFGGDILTFNFASDDIKNQLHVCYVNASFALRDSFNSYLYFSSLVDEDLSELKVIGNIYEPKEEKSE
jgi:hypothetical protein